MRRTAADGSSIVSVTNVTGEPVALPWPDPSTDLLDGSTVNETVVLDGYAARWLVEDEC